MIRDLLVAQNYAQALLNVVESRKMSLEEVLQEAREIRQLLQNEPRLRDFYEGPQFHEETKEEITARVWQGKISLILYQFIVMLLRHGRIVYLIDILDEFESLVLHKQGIVPGTVTTAVPLMEDQKQLIQQRLEATRGTRFSLQFKVDPRLIGGVRVQYGDVLMDTSISTFLSDLRQRLAATRLAS